jgi:hypothetical protein
MHVRRGSNYDRAVASAETSRLRQRHRDHVLGLMRDGISMRTIRRHRLDDPRITDEVRSVLVMAARERQSKAWFRRSEDQRREDRLWTLIRLGPSARNVPATHPNSESPPGRSPAAVLVLDAPALKEAIQAIRRQVCEHFYLAEMRDPEVKVRCNRRVYALPRQIGMYIARKVTGATLQEIGREFGNRHHSTALYSIRKVERMRCTDEALNGTIMQLVDAVAAQS